jgi:hypothetical protein
MSGHLANFSSARYAVLSLSAMLQNGSFVPAEEQRAMGLVIRGLLALGGVAAEWFVATDSPNFGVVQGILATVIFAAVVGIIALWPRRAR